MNLEKKIAKNEETEMINNVTSGMGTPLNEETVVASKPTPIPTPVKPTPTKSKVAAKPVAKEGNGNWTKVVVGGVVGLAFGSAGVFAADYLSSDSDVEGLILDEEVDTEAEVEADVIAETEVAETEVETEVESVAPATNDEVLLAGTHYGVDTSVDVANVSDNMSFGEAFAEARSQVGPGGVFVWNGGIYSTYQAEEWDSMSLAQREEFGDQISYHARTTSNYAENATSSDSSDDYDIEEANVVEAQTYDSPDSEVQILGVTETIADDGSLLTVGQVEIDGQEVFLIDTDQDGIFDVAVADSNNDGIVSDNELLVLEDQDLLVEDLELNMDVQNDQYFADAEPDYINDDFNLV